MNHVQFFCKPSYLTSMNNLNIWHSAYLPKFLVTVATALELILPLESFHSFIASPWLLFALHYHCDWFFLQCTVEGPSAVAWAVYPREIVRDPPTTPVDASPKPAAAACTAIARDQATQGSSWSAQIFASAKRSAAEILVNSGSVSRVCLLKLWNEGILVLCYYSKHVPSAIQAT
jgi:hypothetical protein